VYLKAFGNAKKEKEEGERGEYEGELSKRFAPGVLADRQWRIRKSASTRVGRKKDGGEATRGLDWLPSSWDPGKTLNI